MRQLTGLDAAFLALDTSSSTGNVGGVHIVAGQHEQGGAEQDGVPPLTLARLTELVESRLHLVPPMRRRVVQVPFGLDEPYWIEDPDFDLEFHLRELALPPPGSERQLTELIARIHSRRLDRARPLWELYLIHGLAGGRAAVYAKLHHAMIDGIASQEITAALLDLSPHGRVVEPGAEWVPDPVPAAVELLARSAVSLIGRPRRAAGVAIGLARSSGGILDHVIGPRLQLDRLVGLDRLLDGPRAVARAVAGPVAVRRLGGLGGLGGLGRLSGNDADDAAQGGPEVLFRTPVRAPGTPFNRPVGPHRRFAITSVPLADVKAVKRSTGMTVNDVVMAICAGGLRRWLTLHDALPRGPLVAAVPVSVRARTRARGGASGGADQAYGNHVSLMLATLPTHLNEPLARLRVAHEATLRAKEQHSAVPAELFGELYSATLPALVALASRANARLRVLERVNLFNLFISNVPGPTVPLYLAGHRLVASYPVSAITDGQGLNITVVSYLDRVNFGLIADRELVPDLDLLARFLREELDVLAAG